MYRNYIHFIGGKTYIYTSDEHLEEVFEQRGFEKPYRLDTGVVIATHAIAYIVTEKELEK